MDARNARWILAVATVAAAGMPGCGGAGAGYYPTIELPDLYVTVISASSPLVAGQASSIRFRVQNVGTGDAERTLLQFAGPIGFRYDSVSCLSAGAVACPIVNVQMLAAGVYIPSVPKRSELAFTFQGVTVGDVGSQAVIGGLARTDGDAVPENDAALVYVPIVAAGN